VIGPEGGAWSEGAASVDVLVMSSSVSSSAERQRWHRLSTAARLGFGGGARSSRVMGFG
jgi:hypothetical protein